MPVSSSNRTLRMTGYWKSSKTKHAQRFDVEIRPSGPAIEVEAFIPYQLNGALGREERHNTNLLRQQNVYDNSNGRPTLIYVLLMSNVDVFEPTQACIIVKNKDHAYKQRSCL